MSGAVGVVLLTSPLGLWFTQFSYDLAFVLRPAANIDEATIIYLDDQAHRDLNQPVAGKWDRSLHVRLLGELTARKAKGVVFDLLFDQPWQTPAVDAELAAAMRTNGRVILAASRSSTGTWKRSGRKVGEHGRFHVSRLSGLRSIDRLGYFLRRFVSQTRLAAFSPLSSPLSCCQWGANSV